MKTLTFRGASKTIKKVQKVPCICNLRTKLNFLAFLLQIANTIRLLGTKVKIVPYILDVIWANIGFFGHFWCKNTLAYLAKQAPFGKILTSLPLPPQTNLWKITFLLNVIFPSSCAINIELFLPFLLDIIKSKWIIVQKGQKNSKNCPVL